MKALPGTIILPVGQGGLFLGIVHGIKAIRIDNASFNVPDIIGVQARHCSPFCMQNGGKERNSGWESCETIAEGVKVSNPVRKEEVLREVGNGFGRMCSVEEDDIFNARDALARLGFYVEPTSAIVWPVLTRDIDKLADPIIVILTGSGYKYSQEN
jgi:threonine synthase